MRLQKRIKRNNVAMSGKNRIPSFPIVSRMMPRMKSTIISARLCNLPGTSLRADPAMTIKNCDQRHDHPHDNDSLIDGNIDSTKRESDIQLCSSNG